MRTGRKRGSEKAYGGVGGGTANGEGVGANGGVQGEKKRGIFGRRKG